jgi:dienelactone hydrolase
VAIFKRYKKIRVIKVIVIIAFLFSCLIRELQAQDLFQPDTVTIQSGKLALKALLWHPAGSGRVPAVIFCHGGYETNDTTYDLLENISSIGSVFAKHGYIFLGLSRRGIGLSKGQGKNGADLMAEAFKEKGQEGRNRVQLQQLETDQLNDMIAGLNFLRKRKDVDTKRIGVTGHSFGGSLALLVAEHEPGLKAVIVFSGAGYSWDRSPQLRARLISAVKKIDAPIMIIHAQNDYSLNPGYILDSIRNQQHKPHLLKIYPKIGNTERDGHNFIFRSIETWEADVFTFLSKNL